MATAFGETVWVLQRWEKRYKAPLSHLEVTWGLAVRRGVFDDKEEVDQPVTKGIVP